MTENNCEKKKIHWLAKLAAICFLSVPIICIIVIISLQLDIKISNFVGYTIPVFALCLLASSPLLAIFALIKIYRSNNVLGGQKCAAFAIAGSSLILLLMVPTAAMYYHRRCAPRCGTNLGGIGKTLMTYASDYKGHLPDSKWCDLLIIYEEVPPESFLCEYSDAKYGESSYALNKEAAGMKWGEIPPDLVLVFETNYGKTDSGRDGLVKEREFSAHKNMSKNLNDKVYRNRWNQTGGPELLAVENHNFDGCNILFGNMHIKFIKSEDLPGLRWMLNGKTDFNFPLSHKLKSTASLAKAVLSISVGFLFSLFASAVLYKYRRNQNWPTIIFIGIICGLIGGFFGFLSESLYSFNKFHHLGIIIGSIYGLIVAICYAVILAHSPSGLKRQKSFTEYATAMGMLAGIIFSTIVQIILMIIAARPAYMGGPNPFGILAGMPFGMFAGAILGSISSRFFRESVPEICG